jgi:hypothetical protein
VQVVVDRHARRSFGGVPLLTFIERVSPIELPRLDCRGLLLLGSGLIVNPRLAE